MVCGQDPLKQHVKKKMQLLLYYKTTEYFHNIFHCIFTPIYIHFTHCPLVAKMCRNRSCKDWSKSDFIFGLSFQNYSNPVGQTPWHIRFLFLQNILLCVKTITDMQTFYKHLLFQNQDCTLSRFIDSFFVFTTAYPATHT